MEFINKIFGGKSRTLSGDQRLPQGVARAETVYRPDGQLEQLIYTWSDKGIDTLRAGFRIRAASPGLNDVKSLRTQNLNAFLRYNLPEEANPVFLEVSRAPIAFDLTEVLANREANFESWGNGRNERILNHSIYTGKDGVNRYGSYLSHVIVGLPPSFTATDAIALFNAGFWVRQDDPHGSTTLPTTSTEVLRQYQEYGYQRIPIEGGVLQQANVAYQNLQEGQHLFLLGPNTQVAALIGKIAQSLPDRGSDLTFTTFKSQSEIRNSLADAQRGIGVKLPRVVGTSWIEDAGKSHLELSQRFETELSARNVGTVINLYQK